MSVEQHPAQLRHHSLRRAATALLAVLTVVSIVTTTIAIWLTSTALATDRFVAVIEPVLESPEVAAALEVRLTDDVLEALSLEERLDASLAELNTVLGGELADALGVTGAERDRLESLQLPQLQDLAAPIAGGLEGRIATRIERFVSSPEFGQLLVAGTELAHTRAVALVRGDHDQLPDLEVQAGEVRLDLVAAIATVLEELVDQGLAAVGIDEIPTIDPVDDPEVSLERLAAAMGTELPPDFGQLTVMSEDELVALQTGVRAADQLVWVLLAVSIVLLAATVALAPRRRRVLIHIGLGTAAGVVVTMALLRSTQDQIAGLAQTQQGEDALALLADTGLDSLRGVMLVVILVAMGVASTAYLAGRPTRPSRSAAYARRAAEPERGGSDLARFVVRYHDGLRVAVIAAAVAVLLLAGIELWSLLLVAVLVVVTLWALATTRDRALIAPPVVARTRQATAEGDEANAGDAASQVQPTPVRTRRKEPHRDREIADGGRLNAEGW